MQLLDRLNEQYTENLPFVVYRKPDSFLCRALLQKDQVLETANNFEEEGFVMAPFSEDLPAILIRPDEVLEEIIDTVVKPVPFGQLRDDSRQEGKEQYEAKVKKALDVIANGQLQKVVLSRKITKNLKPNPFHTLQLLLSQFPEAFCYLLYHPKVGIWMGASPETLLKYSQDRISTVSLAGTQKAEINKNTVWSSKEQREQDYVTQYILQALESLVDSPQVSDPVTVKAGNLLHLKTVIEASDPRAGLKEFVKGIHPTPAVCGIPTEKAKAFLQSHEGYRRTYYTGFLGELNWGGENESHLFVNLRCMNFLNDQVHVYVGGGLVEGSDPELEWQETVYKSESMLHLLRNSAAGLG